MTAYFSCSAHKYYDELVQARKKLAAYINASLSDKVYDSIQFLVVHFSTLMMVEEEPAHLEGDGALSLVLRLEGIQESDLAKALLRGLEADVVPVAMRSDLEVVLKEVGKL